MKHRTTRAHYEKYKQMVEDAHIKLGEEFLGYGTEYFLEKYKLDYSLNRIPLMEWDGMVFSYWAYQGRGIIKTLAEGVCTYKHAVVYQLLGAEPEFTDLKGEVNE